MPSIHWSNSTMLPAGGGVPARPALPDGPYGRPSITRFRPGIAVILPHPSRFCSHAPFNHWKISLSKYGPPSRVSSCFCLDTMGVRPSRAGGEHSWCAARERRGGSRCVASIERPRVRAARRSRAWAICPAGNRCAGWSFAYAWSAMTNEYVPCAAARLGRVAAATAVPRIANLFRKVCGLSALYKELSYTSQVRDTAPSSSAALFFLPRRGRPSWHYPYSRIRFSSRITLRYRPYKASACSGALPDRVRPATGPPRPTRMVCIGNAFPVFLRAPFLLPPAQW